MAIHSLEAQPATAFANGSARALVLRLEAMRKHFRLSSGRKCSSSSNGRRRRTQAAPIGLVRLGAIAAAAVITLGACVSGSTGAGSIAAQPPTAGMKPQGSVGAGEGQLNLIALPGYVDASWTNPFTSATGCKVTPKYVTSWDEMVTTMKGGGGGQWDMVSATGDAGLQLIYNGDVKPMNTTLIPDWTTNFQTYFKGPTYNTINGIHYGISLQWGPNVLLYSTKKFPTAPTSWSVIYDASNKGVVTVPDNPMQIADAALYLMKSQPSLNIKDPYELTQKQFDAAVALLMQERPLINKYWALATDEINLFQSGIDLVGAASLYQSIFLKASNVAVADTIPSEGATGWGDTWMLATKAPHPNCAYLWAAWVSTPKVQAEQAILYQETPVNIKACAEMEAIQPGSCAQYHVDPPAAYLDPIRFWKTPLATCDDGTQNCIPYSQWQTAWTSVTA